LRKDTYLEICVKGPCDGWNTFKFFHDHSGADDSIWELRVVFFVMVVQDNDLTKTGKKRSERKRTLT